MMNMTIEMSRVSACSINECAYNVNNNCHAKAITVGDGVHPGCDTFLQASRHTRDATRIAGIGACKVTACRHNDDYECSADQISVGRAAGEIKCMTFAP
ncbi:MAG: DUF1540 domain-containing protein [Pseudomonadota bacterium]